MQVSGERENSKYKGPEAGAYLGESINTKRSPVWLEWGKI